MHGMNVRIQIQPGKVEDAAQLLREHVMPAAANYQGFIQNFLLVDAPNNRIASLSVWQTEADARAIYQDEGGLYQSAVARLQPLLASPPDAWMGPLTRVDSQ
jgi:quinol monooxygenase YgiN